MIFVILFLIEIYALYLLLSDCALSNRFELLYLCCPSPSLDLVSFKNLYCLQNFWWKYSMLISTQMLIRIFWNSGGVCCYCSRLLIWFVVIVLKFLNDILIWYLHGHLHSKISKKAEILILLLRMSLKIWPFFWLSLVLIKLHLLSGTISRR